MPIPLSDAELNARRAELTTIENSLRTMLARKKRLKTEILSGYAVPDKGVLNGQLSLDDQNDLAEAAAEGVIEAVEKAKDKDKSVAKAAKPSSPAAPKAPAASKPRATRGSKGKVPAHA